MSQDPYYDFASSTVRFWVPVGDTLVDARIGKATLHYRFHKFGVTDEPLATYTENAAEIDAAVRRRVAAGARAPIMLRDADVSAPPAG